jgi:ATP/maltotriose-dependent transcriptional regulator MalT
METQTPIPIISPKLQIPPPRLLLVSRERLLEELNRGLHRKLTLISAPAGYGKTTLLSEWAAGCQWRLGWITLAAADNDIERFLAYLVSAMQTVDVGLSKLESILGSHFSLQPMALDAVLAIIINQLSSIADRLVIVLDDYHLIENQEIHGFLSALLDNLPANIHIVISTRIDPPLRLARLRAKDQLNEITEQHLRFTLAEAQTFFEMVMGLRLTSNQVAQLETRTDGWVTGLQLVGLSLKDREHPDELIETLAGTHRYILDYLVQEVYTDLPLRLQNFLLRVSILERLSAGLCDTVVGESTTASSELSESKNILEFLDASNLFVVPLDSQRQWYRFHPLFAEFLHDRLVSQYAHELPGLHRRAATWYMKHNLLSEAVQHSLAAGDIDITADLIQAQAKEMLRRGELSTLLRWIESLPDEAILTRPLLGLAQAWIMLLRDTVNFRDSIDKYINRIAEGFGIQSDSLFSALVDSQPGSTRRSGLAEFAMLQAFTGRDTRDIRETIKLFKVALEYLPDNEQLLRGFTMAGLASTYVRIGEIKLAEDAFAQAALISQAGNSIFGDIASTDWQATMQVEQGQLRRAAATYRQAIEKLSSQGQRPLPLSGHVYIGLASVLLEWNDLGGALENIQMGLQVGIQVKDIDALLFGYVIQARALQALNKSEESQTAIQHAEQQALQTKNIGCILDAQANKALLALRAGDTESAQSWSSARGLTQGNIAELDPPLQEIERLTYTRLLMKRGRYTQALPIIIDLSEVQEQMGRNRALIESLVLQALCLRSLGRIDEAIRILARALLLAEPEGFLRVFIQEGPPMAALLRTVGAQGHSPEYIKHILVVFGEALTVLESLIDPLSERELEVLRLMAQGLTNAEVAAELTIALSTVKTHVNRIYGKLGVSTRTLAVARARQLQIFS